MNKLLATFLVSFGVLELSAAPQSRTILVLPFENKSSRTDVGWMSESFAETLSMRLSGSDRAVLSRIERDAACREAGIPPGTPMTWASAIKVAESLGADWVVTGTFAVNGRVLTSHAYLLDVSRLKISGPFEVNGQLADLAEIQTRLAWRILAMDDKDFTVGSEEDFRRQFPALRLDAHENYVRGVLATEPETRVRFLTEADRRDPSDHRAALELGRFYYEIKDYENSEKWLDKLAPTDADSFEARFMKGVNEFFLGRDAAAEKAFTDLAREVPLTEVWNNLGFLQAGHGLWEEAIVNFDRAYQADSSDPVYSFNLGVCMWNEGKPAVAVRYFREALQAAPDDAEIHRLLGDALAKAGDLEGKKKEDKWLEGRGEELERNANSGILPSPRLKKGFDRKAYRAHARSASPAREVTERGTPAVAPAEAKP